MHIRIRKRGNGAWARIPASVMAAAGLRIGQMVEVCAVDGRVLVEPLRTPAYRLDDLLAEMTPETFPDAVDFGPVVGREVW
jgi:antitoxin MazE